MKKREKRASSHNKLDSRFIGSSRNSKSENTVQQGRGVAGGVGR